MSEKSENNASTTHIHFMGIGGQGISAVAQMAQQIEGWTVTGCDRQASATTRALEQVGIAVQIGHSPEHLVGVETLVISPAVPALDPNNVELVEAHEQGLRVLTWQELLGELIAGKCLLSVSGVHGKGTITAMLSLMLTDAGFDPTCEIGAVVPRFGANYRLGKSEYVVNEADEFNHNFLHYHPRLIVVSSIEFEHPEFFADYDAYLSAFVTFIRGMDMQGQWELPPTLVINRDSEGCLDLLTRLGEWSGHIVTYSVEGMQPTEELAAIPASVLQPDAVQAGYLPDVTLHEQEPTYEAYDVRLEGETSFRLREQGKDLLDRPIQLRLPGVHNIQNALAAFAAARALNADIATIVKTVEEFSGNRRRFDIRLDGSMRVNGREVTNVLLVDDYAHHPTAIALTLEAARRRYPNRRLIAVYQPHMYSRTKTFFEQFLHAFDQADVAIIADIFPARERDTGLVSSRELVEAMSKTRHFSHGDVTHANQSQVLHGGSVTETTALLRETIRDNDIVLVMGAGDIYIVTEQLLQDAEIQGQHGQAGVAEPARESR